MVVVVVGVVVVVPVVVVVVIFVLVEVVVVVAVEIVDGNNPSAEYFVDVIVVDGICEVLAFSSS